MFWMFVMVKKLFNNALEISISVSSQTQNQSKIATEDFEHSLPVHIYLF